MNKTSLISAGAERDSKVSLAFFGKNGKVSVIMELCYNSIRAEKT